MVVFNFLFVFIFVWCFIRHLILVAEAEALDRILLNCGDKRALPRIIAGMEKLEQICEVAVSYAPWGVLPGNACLLGAGALSDRLVVRRLSLLDCGYRVDMSMRMSRDVGTSTATEVGVDVRVDVRVRGRHLDWCVGR